MSRSSMSSSYLRIIEHNIKGFPGAAVVRGVIPTLSRSLNCVGVGRGCTSMANSRPFQDFTSTILYLFTLVDRMFGSLTTRTPGVAWGDGLQAGIVGVSRPSIYECSEGESHSGIFPGYSNFNGALNRFNTGFVLICPNWPPFPEFPEIIGAKEIPLWGTPWKPMFPPFRLPFLRRPSSIDRSALGSTRNSISVYKILN